MVIRIDEKKIETIFKARYISNDQRPYQWNTGTMEGFATNNALHVRPPSGLYSSQEISDYYNVRVFNYYLN